MGQNPPVHGPVFTAPLPAPVFPPAPARTRSSGPSAFSPASAPADSAP